MIPFDAFRVYFGAFTWDDLVTGYDFGFLDPGEIQLAAAGDGPAVQRLRALEGQAPTNFEAHLWVACAEAEGKTPRPGSSRWSQAQDRWREAMLRDALATDTTVAQLAQSVERLYDQVGCPEDMLSILRPSQRWAGIPATVDPSAVQRFLDRSRNDARRYGAAS